MRLVLFDLDGTLLTARGIGRKSTRDALVTVFGTSGRLDDFYPGGRTQEAIFWHTLADAGIIEKDYLAKRDQLYDAFLKNFQENLRTGDYQIDQLPGANQLINYLSESDEFALGLVTGNHQQIARIKLDSAGLEPSVYLAGAYGQESADRSILVPLAKSRVEEKSGYDFPGYYTIVIGDTTRDVISAQSVGAISFALTTGTDDQKMLEEAGADSIFDDLHHVLERFKFLIGRTGGIDGI